MNKTSLLLFLVLTLFGSFLVYRATDEIGTTLLISVDMFVAISVISFAFVQVSLNRKLIELQDYVAVSLVKTPGKDLSVGFYNTGRLNIYIHRIEIRNADTDEIIVATDVFKEPRLVPAGTLESSYYWYPLPDEVRDHKSFKVTLLLTDEFDRKWLSTHGAEFISADQLRVWSHKTSRKIWKVLDKK